MSKISGRNIDLVKFLIIADLNAFRKIVEKLDVFSIFMLALANPQLKTRLKRVITESKYSCRLWLTVYKGDFVDRMDCSIRPGVMELQIKFGKERNEELISWAGKVTEENNTELLNYKATSDSEPESIRMTSSIYEVLTELIEFYEPRIETVDLRMHSYHQHTTAFKNFMLQHTSKFSFANTFVNNYSQWMCDVPIAQGKYVSYMDFTFSVDRLVSILLEWKNGGLTNLQKLTVDPVWPFHKRMICESVGAAPWDPTKRDKVYIDDDDKYFAIENSFDIKQNGTEKIASLQFQRDSLVIHVWASPTPVVHHLMKLRAKAEIMDQHINLHLPNLPENVRNYWNTNPTFMTVDWPGISEEDDQVVWKMFERKLLEVNIRSIEQENRHPN